MSIVAKGRKGCMDVMDEDTSLRTEVGSTIGDIVLDGYPVPHAKGHNSPSHFATGVYCGQTVAHLSKPTATLSELLLR